MMCSARAHTHTHTHTQVQNAETAEAMLDITRHVAANDAASLDVDAAKAWLTPLQSKPQ